MSDFFHKHGNLITGLLLFFAMTLMGYYTIIGKNIERGILLRMPIELTTSEGLNKGAKVFIQGVEVGSVGSMYYFEVNKNGWPRKFNQVQKSYGQTVIAILHLKLKVPFYENYVIKTKHSTLLSAKIVEITPGHAIINTNPNNKEFDHKTKFAEIHPLTLDSSELINLQMIGYLPKKLDRTLVIAKNYDDPLFQIAKVMQENRRDLHAITTDFREITHKLDRGNGSIAKVVNQPVLLAGVNGLLKEIIVLTGEAGKGVEDLRESQSIIEFLELVLAFSGALY